MTTTASTPYSALPQFTQGDLTGQYTFQDPDTAARTYALDNLARQISSGMINYGTVYNTPAGATTLDPNQAAYIDAQGNITTDQYVYNADGTIIGQNRPSISEYGGPSQAMPFETADIDYATDFAEQMFMGTPDGQGGFTGGMFGRYDPYASQAQAALGQFGVDPAGYVEGTSPRNAFQQTASAMDQMSEIAGGARTAFGNIVGTQKDPTIADVTNQGMIDDASGLGIGAYTFNDPFANARSAGRLSNLGITGAFPGAGQTTSAFGDVGYDVTGAGSFLPDAFSDRFSGFTAPTAFTPQRQTVSDYYSGLGADSEGAFDATQFKKGTAGIDPFAALTAPDSTSGFGSTQIGTDPFGEGLGISQFQFGETSPYGYSVGEAQPSVSNYYKDLKTNVAAPTAFTKEGKGLTEQAGAVLQSGLGYLRGAAPASENRFDPSADVADYMNPYNTAVRDVAIQQLQEAEQKQANQDAANAVASGAFGGSRAAVIDAVRQSELAKNQAALTAQLESQGYDKALANAMAAYEADKASDLAVGTAMTGTARELGQLGQTEAGIANLGFQQGLGKAAGQAQFDQTGIGAYSAYQNALAAQAQGELGFLGLQSDANTAYNQALLSGASGEQATAIANQRAAEAYNQALLAQAGGTQATNLANLRAQQEFNRAMLDRAAGRTSADQAGIGGYDAYMNQLMNITRGQQQGDMNELARYEAMQRAMAAQAGGQDAFAGQRFRSQSDYNQLMAQLARDDASYQAQQAADKAAYNQMLLNTGRLGLEADIAQSGAYGQQAAGLQGLGALYGQYGLAAGEQLGNLGLAASNLGQRYQQTGLTDIGQALQFGSMYQQQRQNELDALRRNRMMDYYAPMQGFEMLARHQVTPGTMQVFSGTPSPTTNPLAQAIGTFTGGLSMLGSMGGGTQQRSV